MRGVSLSADPDQRRRFIFEHANVRGELIHLDHSYQEVLRRHDYPAPVARLLGEAMAAAGLLAATVKFQGSLILQIQGEGPVTMAVASASHASELRAVARHGEPDVADGPLAELCGEGYLAITIDPDESNDRYQGIVPLKSESLAEAVDGYFAQSEQLPTRIWLACDGESAAGLLLQRLPDAPNPDADAWDRAEHLAGTIRPEELLQLPIPDILHRLFHEEDIRLYAPEPMRFHCPCSRERVAEALFSLGRAESESIVAEQGEIETHCDFCGQSYVFDPVDVEQLFSGEGDTTPPGRTRH
ncbi:Hsp33 family molecular chaperone HslO [Methylonatrum kenyense]|nr:Hsp33 family molecular chaperone HslO [Methylonatrum kenyense]MCK8516534.1 Hsp33 family molecular chaperone HslO [Methylonatrum kenyense]